MKRLLWSSTFVLSLFIWLGFCGLFLFKSRAQQTPTSAQPELPKLTLHIGHAHVDAEVANTPGQLEAGLMFRRKLADNGGMIFVLGRPQQAVFWMENTIVPLSVAYIDREGRILEIYDMKPFDRTAIPSRSKEIAYALEVNQGWFQLNGVTPGTRIDPQGAVFGRPPLSVP